MTAAGAVSGPLTGWTAGICRFMKLRWEKPDFEEVAAGTDRWCPEKIDARLKRAFEQD